MRDTILVALISLLVTAFGSVAGILAANRLVVYRIEQLEEKVAKHNNMMERIYRLEAAVEKRDKRKEA